VETVLAGKRALALAFTLSLALAVPSLGLGFISDDYAFRALLHSTSSHAPASWDLFQFQSGDPVRATALIRVGRLVWWAAPDLRIHFLRPLTSLLFAAEDRLFGDAALGYHVSSLLWFGLLLAGVAALFRRILPPTAATLGLAVFGFAAAHSEAYAWISAQHALLGGVGAAWALALYARGVRPRPVVALLVLALGLTASESALGAIPLCCALALGDGARPVRERLVAAAPPFVLGLLYLVAYAALGGGTRASGGYHDPMTEPLTFASVAALRLPILLGNAALGIPAELAFRAPAGPLALAGIGAVAFVALAWHTTGAQREHGELGWLALGGLAALLPGAAGYPVGRVLVVPDLAFAAVIGAILARASSASGAGKAIAVLLGISHLACAPLLSLRAQRSLARRGRGAERVAHEVSALVPAGGRAFLVAASDPFVFLYPRGILAQTAPGMVSCWSVLSAARASHRLTRIGERRLALEPIERPLLAGSFDTLFRAPDRAFSVGDTVEQCGATLRVSALRDGLPTRLEITFQRQLDDPKLAFLIWRDQELTRLALPALGETVELPWSPGPSGAL